VKGRGGPGHPEENLQKATSGPIAFLGGEQQRIERNLRGKTANPRCSPQGKTMKDTRGHRKDSRGKDPLGRRPEKHAAPTRDASETWSWGRLVEKPQKRGHPISNGKKPLQGKGGSLLRGRGLLGKKKTQKKRTPDPEKATFRLGGNHELHQQGKV